MSNLLKNKKISILFNILLVVISLVLVFLFVKYGYKDLDQYFLIATGRKIRQEGILHTNPFSATPNLKIVVQQWAYCVLLSFMYDKLGDLGLFITVLFFNILLVLLMYSIISLHSHIRRKTCLILISAIFALCNVYSNVRPELLTTSIILLSIFFMEKYRLTTNKIWLYLMPLLVLIQINFHASYWILTFFVMFVYILPEVDIRINKNFYIKFKKNNFNKDFIIPIALMFCMLFVNPYGLDSILYVFRSVGEIAFVDIVELRGVQIASVSAVGILSAYILCIYAYYKKICTQQRFLISLAFITLLCSCNKWWEFVPIILCLLFVSLDKVISKKNIQEIIKYLLCFLMFVFVEVCFVMCVRKRVEHSIYDSMVKITDFTKNEINRDYKVRNNTEDVNEENIVVLAPFVISSGLEFYNYKIVIDARPELYLSVINGKEDVLKDWYKLNYGYFKEPVYYPVDENLYVELLKKYNVDYVVYSNRIDGQLAVINLAKNIDSLEMVSYGSHCIIYHFSND